MVHLQRAVEMSESISGLDIDESYNYIQRVINLEYSDYLFAG